MLIDDWMRVYVAVERHERADASPGAMVYAALWRTDFAASGVVRWLLALRGLGKPRSLTLASLTESGFVKLGDRPPHEVVLGVAGKFWTPSGGRVRLDARGLPSLRAARLRHGGVELHRGRRAERLGSPGDRNEDPVRGRCRATALPSVLGGG